MGGGVVLERGKHDELLSNEDGPYARLVAAQRFREAHDDIHIGDVVPVGQESCEKDVESSADIVKAAMMEEAPLGHRNTFSDPKLTQDLLRLHVKLLELSAPSRLTREDDCLELYSEYLDVPLRNFNRKSIPSTLLYSISQSFAFFAIALVFWYGSRLVSYGEFTAKQFFTATMVS